MNQPDKNITDAASEFVFDLFKNRLPPHYIYHNYRHTEEVAEAARKIAGKMNLSEEDTEIVTLAAWLHDTGFVERSHNHEDSSIEIAQNFLKERNYSGEKTEKIIGCINATRFPQTPKNILEEIMADADLFHIGTKDYKGRSDLLRIEWENAANKKYTDLEWLKINTDFLTSHKFFTKYAKKTLDEGKEETLVKLQKEYRKIASREEKIEKKRQEIIDERKRLREETADKIKSDTVVNINSKNSKNKDVFLINAGHKIIQSCASADRKTMNMISVNTFMFLITGFFSAFITKYDTDSLLLIPALILLLTSLICILVSVMAAFPVINKLNAAANDTGDKKFNIFSDELYTDSDHHAFEKKINDALLTDPDFAARTFNAEYFYLRKEMIMKNRYLRLCYTVFIFGLTAAVAAYAIAVKLSPEKF